MKNNLHFPFWLLSISVFLVLIVPSLIQDGMFMDGIQYACVSKNLNDGLGSFWFPHLSQTWAKATSSSFMEHPPLVYGLQSLFFKFLGSSMYTERIYSLFTAVITACLIILIWKLIFKSRECLKKLSWLPVLFWIIIPVCFWSYQNNLMENTMSIFTLSSVFFSIKVLKSNTYRFLWIILSGLSIFSATFSKGVPGLFPVMVFSIYWLIYRDISFLKTFTYTLLLILIPLLIYSFLIINDDAYRSLSFYFNDRLLNRISSEPTVNNRLFIIVNLITELLPSIIMSFVLLFIIRIKSVSLNYLKKSDKKNIYLFLFIGLSASVPLILTPVQRGFYLVPSFPFFGISLALVTAPGLKQLINRINIKRISFRIFKLLSVLFLAATITYTATCYGKSVRDQEMLKDIYLIGNIVPNNTVIKIDNSMYENWYLQFYLLRYFNISVTPSTSMYNYYLREKTSKDISPEGCKNIPLSTKLYDLYKLNNNLIK